MTATAKRIEQEIRELTLEAMLVLHDQLVTSIHEKEEAQKLDPLSGRRFSGVSR